MSYNTKEIKALYECIICIIDKTASYISALSPLVTVTFFADDQSYKKAYAHYRRLSTNIIKLKDSADSVNSTLSLRICQADKDMDVDALRRYTEVFERYQSWSNSFSKFFSDSEDEFTKNKYSLKISVLLSFAQLFFNQSKDIANFLDACMTTNLG